jgi:dihydrofolate reductase
VGLTQYYTATTLDGFIADPDNSLEWLFTRAQDERGPLNYGDFIAEVGALAMGSTTYEWILDHEFAGKDPTEWKWPYEVPCWVFTHRELTLVPNALVEFTSADVTAVHAEMAEAAGGRNVWIVGGGDLAGQFADAGLLDEVLVSIAPVTLVPARRCCRAGSSCGWRSWGETATSRAPVTPSSARARRARPSAETGSVSCFGGIERPVARHVAAPAPGPAREQNEPRDRRLASFVVAVHEIHGDAAVGTDSTARRSVDRGARIAGRGLPEAHAARRDVQVALLRLENGGVGGAVAAQVTREPARIPAACSAVSDSRR